MTVDQDEVPLRGGRVTAGVVRVGDTVRRPATANSDFVRRLLGYLATRHFDGAPAALGIDERGRDIFAFISGDVPADLGFHDDATLRQAAALIRRYHDLTAEFVAMSGAGAPGIEIVCHNDLSPCNFVFRQGVPVAIIDFDAAAHGSRNWDLGYAAWLWLDLGSPEIAAAEQRRRLALFLDGYGTGEVGPVLSKMLERQRVLEAEGVRVADIEMAKWAGACLDWTRRNIAAPG
jgi:aminoglycoside phosphotransferase (APT) family kinase protein